ncbi:MAG: S-ribosylhomocysteine lyase [Epsilonproteobacteria bacterium]|nr:S-ribosylhomocysteine lyase [Campylobacterota bacterium]
MPMLDSFMVDHTKMNAPGVRLAKTMKTPSGDVISVYDLRFVKPNKEVLSSKGLHTLEHLFAGYMRDHLAGYDIIDISPMGCRTGFYMSVIGKIKNKKIRKAFKKSMQDILQTTEIPEANIYQCGSCYMHSLKSAKKIANKILAKKIKKISNKKLKLKGKVPNICNIEDVKEIG